ncbi:unnamed protein product [Brassica oleracea]
MLYIFIRLYTCIFSIYTIHTGFSRQNMKENLYR